MENQNHSQFGAQLRSLRESKFPGQSLRRVGEFLSSQGFGDYFYTQLSKIESELLFPSAGLLLRVLDAYNADSTERNKILTAYSSAMAWRAMARVDTTASSSTRHAAVHQLYRKVKRKK